jgi:hypothetical protein
MKYFISNFKVNSFYTFILLYARLLARSSFDMVKRPSSSFRNPILLAISRQTDISLLSRRQYRKSSSSVPLNTKAPFGYFSFWRSVWLLRFLLWIIFPRSMSNNVINIFGWSFEGRRFCFFYHTLPRRHAGIRSLLLSFILRRGSLRLNGH